MFVTAETIVNVPIDTAWQEFNDKEQSTHWIQSLQHVESLTGAPLTPGTKLRYIYKEGGRDNEMTEEIMAVDAPNRIDSVYETKVMRSDQSFRFESVGNGQTKIIGEMRLKPTHIVMRLMLFFFKGAVRKRLQGDLDRFRELINKKYASA